MNVKELKELLSQYPDDMPIRIEYPDGHQFYIVKLGIPPIGGTILENGEFIPASSAELVIYTHGF